jgi:hypothetical protein
MSLVADLIAARRREGNEIWIAGAASVDQVAALERALELSLPPAYVAFLRTYGALGIGDSFVSGIVANNALDATSGSAYGDTLQFQGQKGFPARFIVVGKHEDGAYCLDMNRRAQDSECPIVNFEFGSLQHDKPVASNFEQWLIQFRLS